MKRLSIFIHIFITSLFLSDTANAAAWQIKRSFWTDQDEKIYSNFVEKICDSKYGNLNKFIKDPKVNPLYGEEDKKFNLSPDCADLPYLVRAYVAYKLRLPFSYVSEISGRGGDERYSRGNKPIKFKDQDYFSSPQQLFSNVTLVNSGYFRMDATCETSDHYPIKINKKNLTPGTVYYDPDGHVALVAKVFDNGRIRLIDAHPDKSISKPWFGSKFSKGNKNNGGGFKKWRQIRYTSDGRTVRTQNHNLKDYSATDQYQKSFSINGQSGIGYHDYVRLAMTSSNSHTDPLQEFVFMMQDIYEDIKYRALAVDVAIQKGCHLKPHPGKLPYNIYGTDGIWEELSTPSRDARLKVAFREFYDTTRQMVMKAEQYDPKMAKALAYNFLLKYDELAPKLCITYVNSAGRSVYLNFADVNKRLFDLSFDPYHSIEYRWGANGQELATANDGETKRKFYALEKRLRNQMERVYGCHTPLSMGMDNPISVDVRGWLYAYIQGNKIDRNIIAFNKETIYQESYTTNSDNSVEKTTTTNEKPTEVAVVSNPNTVIANIKTQSVPSNNLYASIDPSLINRNPVQIPTLAKKEVPVEKYEKLEKIEKDINEDNSKLLEDKKDYKESDKTVELEVKEETISDKAKTEIVKLVSDIEDFNSKDEEINQEKNHISSSEPDFWNSLLITGDQLAASISDKDNYGSSR